VKIKKPLLKLFLSTVFFRTNDCEKVEKFLHFRHFIELSRYNHWLSDDVGFEAPQEFELSDYSIEYGEFLNAIVNADLFSKIDRH